MSLHSILRYLSSLKKMNILQINTVGNIGSTGRIAEQIGIEAMRNGWESYIACARAAQSKSKIIRIGSKWHRYPNVLWTRIFDSDSPLAKISTLKLTNDIKKLSPDIIHLHNIHGYYLHTPTLLEFLGEYNKPVVWTLHDCWPFTGHCAHFDFFGCKKWKTLCSDCPQKNKYPASWVFDSSSKNHIEKTAIISKIKKLTFVPVSKWTESIALESKVKFKNIQTIRNGIDIGVFQPSQKLAANSINNVLFAANKWEPQKGLNFIPKIAERLGSDYKLTVIGVDRQQKKYLEGKGIIAQKRTNNIKQLRDIYSQASVFANPTLEETLSLVNMEAIACGTPVVTFASGGTPETVPNEKVGAVVKRGDIDAMVSQIKKFAALDKSEISKICRQTAIDNFDAKAAFKKYIDLYESLS